VIDTIMRAYFLSDEERGKKDDDHKHHRHASGSTTWQPARSPRRKLLKRALLAGLLVVFVILFIRNIPTRPGAHPGMRRPAWKEAHAQALGNGQPLRGSDLSGPRPPTAPQPHQAEHVDQGVQATTGTSTASGDEERNAPPPPGAVIAERSYNGPLKFAKLAVSLKAIGATNGNANFNKNILFAVSSLKSAATLIPMACEMGLELRSYVHVAIMGRSEIHLKDLMKINGADEGCSLIYHDIDRVSHGDGDV